MRLAEGGRSASSVTSSSIRVSLGGKDVDWMTNTSSPRTFSWISTNTSMSAKRRIEALVSGNSRISATASARGRLLLQDTIFIGQGPLNKERRTGLSAGNEAASSNG